MHVPSNLHVVLHTPTCPVGTGVLRDMHVGVQVRLRAHVQRRITGHFPEEDDGAESDTGGAAQCWAGCGTHGCR